MKCLTYSWNLFLSVLITMKKDLISCLRTAFAMGAYFTKDSIDEFNTKKVSFTSQSSVFLSLHTRMNIKMGSCNNCIGISKLFRISGNPYLDKMICKTSFQATFM